MLFTLDRGCVRSGSSALPSPERISPGDSAQVRIKQHLQIKKFYDYSENAVLTQLWIAASVYCLLAIIHKELGAERELHEIQEILSASIFQKNAHFAGVFYHEDENR